LIFCRLCGVTRALQVKPETSGEGLPSGRGELDSALPRGAGDPAAVEQRGEDVGAELAGQVVALLAPVQAEPQQRPPGRAVAGRQSVGGDAEAGEDVGCARPQLPGMLGQLARQPIGGPAPVIRDSIGRRQGLVVDQGLGELDAELSRQVVVAGPGRTQRRRPGRLPQRPDRLRGRELGQRLQMAVTWLPAASR
jgi:hypothetical protein